jgi:hypothetical protein
MRYLNGFGSFGALGYPAGTKETAQVTWFHSQAQAASAAANGTTPGDWVIKDFVNHNATLPTPATTPADIKALMLKQAGFIRSAALEPSWGGNADDLAYATKIEALINSGADPLTPSTQMDQAITAKGQSIPAPSQTSIATPAAIAAAGGAANVASPGGGVAVVTTSWGLYAAIGGGSLLLLAGVAKVAQKRKAKRAAAAATPVRLNGIAWRKCHQKARSAKQHQRCMTVTR